MRLGSSVGSGRCALVLGIEFTPFTSSRSGSMSCLIETTADSELPGLEGHVRESRIYSTRMPLRVLTIDTRVFLYLSSRPVITLSSLPPPSPPGGVLASTTSAACALLPCLSLFWLAHLRPRPRFLLSLHFTLCCIFIDTRLHPVGICADLHLYQRFLPPAHALSWLPPMTNPVPGNAVLLPYGLCRQPTNPTTTKKPVALPTPS